MTKETNYTFDVLGTWHLFNSINLGFINFNTSFRNFMPQDNTFINHKVALFPIQHKISFFTSLQNSIKIAQAIVKRGTIDGKIVHENLTNLLEKSVTLATHHLLITSQCLPPGPNNGEVLCSRRSHNTTRG